MSGRVAIVTDSTASLPGDAGELDVVVVPLRVNLGDRVAIDDGHDVTPAQVTRALRKRRPVSTSRPTPEEFAQVYRKLLEDGADNVVSIHISAPLSGTWESATLAAQDFPHGAVRVVDSRSTAMALGYAVAAAAECAAEGGSAAEVQGVAVATVDRTRTLFYVDTLEHLRRGGRIGPGAALLATSLKVKPLLQMVEGQIVPLEKVRTSSRAMARLVELTAAAAGDRTVDLAVHHLDAPDRAVWVASQMQEAIPHVGQLHVAELGAVISAHLGPGVIGTVLVRRP